MSKLIYGRNAITSALEIGKVQKVYLKEGFNEERILSLIRKQKVPYEFAVVSDLTNLVSSSKHQGIAALIDEFRYASFEEIIEGSKKKARPLILILDGIQDPHNFGAIIRTAAAFSIDGIIIKDRNQVQVTDTVQKVAVGTIDNIKICKVNNLNNIVRKLKDNGYWIYASALKNSVDYLSLKFDRPSVLVMGSEGDGISRLLLDNSDYIMRINMNEAVESLNVSVATGILLAKMRE